MSADDGGSLVDAVKSGDRRRALTALRDFLAVSLENGDEKSTAPIAKQLADVLRELDAMPAPEGSALDDLAARRASRRATATGT